MFGTGHSGEITWIRNADCKVLKLDIHRAMYRILLGSDLYGGAKGSWDSIGLWDGYGIGTKWEVN